MIIVNEALLVEFRNAGRCEWCKRGTVTDAHHVFCRGIGGGGRLDVPYNLMSLCRECRQNFHAGVLTQDDLLAVVAVREKAMQGEIKQAIWVLRRLPKDPTPERLGHELGGLNAVEKRLVGRGILFAGERS